jgi:hypothetical protein
MLRAESADTPGVASAKPTRPESLASGIEDIISELPDITARRIWELLEEASTQFTGKTPSPRQDPGRWSLPSNLVVEGERLEADTIS